MLLSTQLPSAVESWTHVKTYLPSAISGSYSSSSPISMENPPSSSSNLLRDNASSVGRSILVDSLVGSDVNSISHLPGSLLEDNCSNSAATRKRKISKMWETVYTSLSQTGLQIPDGHNFGHQGLYTTLNRTNEHHDNRQPQKELRKDSTTKMANWRIAEITENLAADFDDSLSGLGVELGSAPYNMSEALMALPAIPVFKQEPDSENGCHHGQPSASQSPSMNSGRSISSHNNSGLMLHNTSPYTPIHSNCVTPQPQQFNNSSFQYILKAATSIATKMSEESLTYLNQGQSYEINLKKLGDVSEYVGKFKSIIRICFHERRLQYMEKQQISNWRQTRPGERILDIDIPLSYNISDVIQDSVQLNVAEFTWDPSKSTGVHIRVNCISTEFTPKKHGGEKGVPFRIQMETFSTNDGSPQRLSCASCQVKVFKPKGADRKHKTDRERMEKKSGSDQDKFKPAYPCTYLVETPLDNVYTIPTPPSSVSSTIPSKKNESVYSPRNEQPGTPNSLSAESPVLDSDTLDSSAFELLQMYQQSLSIDASAIQTTQWLQANRFGSYVRTLASFSGADILRLSKDDIIQICGMVDGIRLYNALRSRPRLTIYVSLEQEQVYHAIYLDQLTLDELINKLLAIVNFPLPNVQNLFIQGPTGVHIVITDEVVRNLNNESLFKVELIKNNDHFQLLLKPAPSQ